MSKPLANPPKSGYSIRKSNYCNFLTAYDGKTITYDQIGNPLTDGTWNYTWEHGRQLDSMTKVNGSVTWDYTYNANGMRIKRTNGSKTYEYTYAGSELVHMSVDGVHLRFGHTPDGVPFNVVYGWETYFYVTNLQGDVVAILDSYGDPMVYYTYDAWGNILSTTGSMATTLGALNPFRYRGYVYDTETGLYYVSSRYYNPELGRFISADHPAYLGSDGSLPSYNLFAYCNNNPVMYADPSGHFVLSTFLVCLGIGVVTGAGLGALSAIQQGTDVWRGIVTGALLGGVIGSAAGLALAGATGGVAAGIGKSFLKAGAKSIVGKFTADLTAYAAWGKEIGSLESYMSAFVFGGSVGAFGLKGSWKAAADIFARPAYSILVDDILFKGDTLSLSSLEKYTANVAIRGMTYGLPGDLKPISRGLLNGWYRKYHFSMPNNLMYTF